MIMTQYDFTWLLDKLLTNTPGARHALLLSADGLKRSYSSGLGEDQADQLAAIASGLQGLAGTASAELGDGTGKVHYCATSFGGGTLFIVQADQGSHVAAVADEESDVGLIGHNLRELVRELGEHLRTPARRPAPGGQPA